MSFLISKTNTNYNTKIKRLIETENSPLNNIKEQYKSKALYRFVGHHQQLRV